MSAVSETIVREYFELLGFFVRQQRKYIAPARRENDEIDFFVHNPRATSGQTLPFVLSSADLAGVARAMVVVKGWHTETFSLAVLANAPEIFRFVQPGVFKQATKVFSSDGPFTKILVVPALPSDGAARQASIELLLAKGVDAVIPFHTMLAEIIAHIEANRKLSEKRSTPSHPHPEELRILRRAADGVVQGEA